MLLKLTIIMILNLCENKSATSHPNKLKSFPSLPLALLDNYSAFQISHVPEAGLTCLIFTSLNRAEERGKKI